MDKILEILSSLHPDISFEGRTDLIDGGIIDSFDIVTLVGELSDTFEVEIGLEHLSPENFNSAESILAMLESLGAEL